MRAISRDGELPVPVRRCKPGLRNLKHLYRTLTAPDRCYAARVRAAGVDRLRAEGNGASGGGFDVSDGLGIVAVVPNEGSLRGRPSGDGFAVASGLETFAQRLVEGPDLHE